MADDSRAIRREDHAPRHLRKPVQDEGTEPPLSGVVHLTEEARNARTAGRKLAADDDGTGEADIPGTVKKLREEIAVLRQDNKRIAVQLSQTLYEMRGMVDRLESLYANAEDAERAAQQAALDGVNKAQRKAEEITLRNIDEATKRSRKAIDTMVLESKRRIERLAMVTLPDRLFHFLKWTALMLALFIMVHVIWQMFS